MAEYYRKKIVDNMASLKPKNKLSKEILDNIFWDLMTKIEPTMTFEAGAYDGTFSIAMSKIIERNNVHAIEADPYCYNKYKDSFNDSGFVYEHLAITKENGPVTLKIVIRNDKALGGITSLSERNSIGDIEYNDYEDYVIEGQTIDTYFANKLSDDTRLYMWLDVEGLGHDILCSATETLKKTVAIKIEVEKIQYWKDQKLDNDVIDLMIQNDFIPLVRDFQSPNQYNILFVNRNLCSDRLLSSLVTDNVNPFSPKKRIVVEELNRK